MIQPFKKLFFLFAVSAIMVLIVFFNSYTTAKAAESPGFTDLWISGVTQTTAIVAWQTNELTDSFITVWGERRFTAGKDESVRMHFVNLNTLSPGTRYEVQAFTTFRGSRYTSEVARFTTLPGSLESSTPNHGNVTATSAMIYWTTNNPSDSHVQYYTGPADAQVAGQADTVVNHAVQLINLRPNTTYSYRAKSRDRNGNEFTSDAYTFRTLGVLVSVIQPRADSTPPAISNLQHSRVSLIGATISWNANEEANSWVFYSTTATDDTFVMEYEFNTGTNAFVPAGPHQIVLSSLSHGTTYSYRAISKDRAQNFGVSVRGTFRTLGVPHPQARFRANAGGAANNQNLANQGDEDLTRTNEEADIVRTELRGNETQSITITNTEPSKNLKSSTLSAVQTNLKKVAQPDNLKSPQNSFLKKAGGPTDFAALDRFLDALSLTKPVEILLLSLLIGGLLFFALFVFIKKVPSSRPVVFSAAATTVLIIMISMAPFISSFIIALPYHFGQNDNDKALEKTINQRE